MTATAVVITAVVFIYAEAAIVTGMYMYLITKDKAENTEDKEKKQIKWFSVAAGLFFPVTLAIIAAYKLAERTTNK